MNQPAMLYLPSSAPTPNYRAILARGANPWDAEEERQLRTLWPDEAAFMALYPHRTFRAVMTKARKMRLPYRTTPRQAQTPWSAKEVSTLKRLYPSTPWPEIHAALPGRTQNQIVLQVRYLATRGVKLVRKIANPRDAEVHPVVLATIAEAARRNMTLADLDELTKTRPHGEGAFFTKGRHRMPIKKLRWTRIMRAAVMLGGDVSITFKPEVDHA
ncbi:MAG: SANT/Myb-like DNA-binding domain-containing protein [Caulobacteraceae bacterium]